MHIFNLHEDAFRAILDRIPLQALIPLRAVCERWRSTIDTVCRSRRSLMLFDRFDHVYAYANRLIELGRERDPTLRILPIGTGRDNDIVLTWRLTGSQTSDADELARSIVDRFPAIDRLVTHLDESTYECGFVVALIARWRNQLRQISLFGDLPATETFSCGIRKSFEQNCGALSRLELDNSRIFAPKTFTIDCDMFRSLTRTITELALHSCVCEPVNDLPGLPQILAPFGVTLRRLSLDRIDVEQWCELFRIEPRFGAMIDELCIDDIDGGSIGYFCAENRFANLRKLEIGVDDDIKFRDIILSLQRLPRLAELRFKTFSAEQLQYDDISHLPTHLPSQNILPALQQLEFYRLYVCSMSRIDGPNLFAHTMATLFPAICRIRIRTEMPGFSHPAIDLLGRASSTASSVMMMIGSESSAPTSSSSSLSSSLRPDDIRFAHEKYQIYSCADMRHVGRWHARCAAEKRSRKMMMCGDELTETRFFLRPTARPPNAN